MENQSTRDTSYFRNTHEMGKEIMKNLVNFNPFERTFYDCNSSVAKKSVALFFMGLSTSLGYMAGSVLGLMGRKARSLEGTLEGTQ